MTSEELDRLAALIAAEIERNLAPATPVRRAWLPEPVRPAGSPPPGEAPVWSAAAQSLGDVAPARSGERTVGRRDDPGAATASIRAAAAGKGPARQARGSRVEHAVARSRGGVIEVPIGISNRHVHLSAEDATRLFGAPLTVQRPLSQPGQFAATQRINVVGPTGRIDGIRVVGPARGVTQLELALSDAAVLGVAPPIANSGKLAGTPGGVTIEGTSGSVALRAGVIVAARHLHLSVEDGRRWHLADGDVVTVRCGRDARSATLHGVLVRCGAGHATELHLDVDEARAVGVKQGDVATVLESARPPAQRRVLVTERDVITLSSRGEQLPPGALLTPGARDRARALGIEES